MKRIQNLISVFFAGIFPVALFATPITARQAQSAATGFLSGVGAMASVPVGKVGRATIRNCGAGKIFVVPLDKGGYVVTGNDTTCPPIILWSDHGAFPEDEESPAWDLLRAHVDANLPASAPSRRGMLSTGAAADGEDAEAAAARHSAAENAWVHLLSPRAKVQNLEAAPQDLRVAPMLQSTWNQKNEQDAACYNYYTPSNYLCGCVATAGAQVMRYFEWPVAGTEVHSGTFPCSIDGHNVKLTSQGGIFDWAQMPLSPALENPLSEESREAIGKLTSDIGIICSMDYDAKGSGTGCYMLVNAFEQFGYSNAMSYLVRQQVYRGQSSYFDDSERRAIISNLDAGLPVILGIRTIGGTGHAVVADGYGYNGEELNLHINFGWSGVGNAWYVPPSLKKSYDFRIINEIVYNIYTNQDAHAVICSGRVLDEHGTPLAGATVSAKRLDSGTASIVAKTLSGTNGIYALRLEAGNYEIKSQLKGKNVEKINITVEEGLSLSLCSLDSTYGSYYISPAPTVGNQCDLDFVMSKAELVTMVGFGSSSPVVGIAKIVDEPVFSPEECVFFPETNVVITCKTENAVIHYTLDGSEPDENSPVYVEPLKLEATSLVKARAYCDKYTPSHVVSATYTYDVLHGGMPGDFFALPIHISGESGTYVVEDNSGYTLEKDEPLHSLQDGKFYNQAHSVWFGWTAPANGTVTFTLSMSSASKPHLPNMIAVYDREKMCRSNRIAMCKDYKTNKNFITTVNFDVKYGTEYRIVAATMNENYIGSFNLAWNGKFEAVSATMETEFPVAFAWLDEHFPGLANSINNYENIAASTAANGINTVAECYLLGIDPTNENDKFKVFIHMENGLPVIEYSPENADIGTLGFEYRVKGKASLSDVEWKDDEPDAKFFRVFIEKTLGK